MSAQHGGNGTYLLTFSVKLAKDLEQLHRRAFQLADASSFKASLRRIIRALRAYPRPLGEPLYRLAALRLQVRVVIDLPLAIEYGVSEDRPVVYVKSGKLLSARR